RDGARPDRTRRMNRNVNGSDIRWIDVEKAPRTSRAMPRRLRILPSVVRHETALGEEANGFSGKELKRASHPLRDVCGTGANPAKTGMPRFSSSSSVNESHVMTSRTMH